MIGLSPDEFWALTPREWGLVVDGYLEREKRRGVREKNRDYRAALICATIVNFSPLKDQKTRPCEINDFMPTEVKPKKPQTESEMLAVVKVLNAAFGGKVVEQ